jgi:hypothetical protein
MSAAVKYSVSVDRKYLSDFLAINEAKKTVKIGNSDFLAGDDRLDRLDHRPSRGCGLLAQPASGAVSAAWCRRFSASWSPWLLKLNTHWQSQWVANDRPRASFATEVNDIEAICKRLAVVQVFPRGRPGLGTRGCRVLALRSGAEFHGAAPWSGTATISNPERIIYDLRVPADRNSHLVAHAPRRLPRL